MQKQTNTSTHSLTDLLTVVADCFSCTWLSHVIDELQPCDHRGCTLLIHFMAFYAIVSVGRENHYFRPEPGTENTKWPYTRALYLYLSPTHLHNVFLLYLVILSFPLSLTHHALTHTFTIRERINRLITHCVCICALGLKGSWRGIDVSEKSLLTGR